MPGSPTFSAEAARVLVDAYLAQPEGNRDLRRVLAAAREGLIHKLLPDFSDPTVQNELAGMSKSQAYELLRQDPRYQPSTSEQAEELSQRNLDLAREIIDFEAAKPPYKRNIDALKRAQSLVGMVHWQKAEIQKAATKGIGAAPRNGLTGLLT